MHENLRNLHDLDMERGGVVPRKGFWLWGQQYLTQFAGLPYRGVE